MILCKRVTAMLISGQGDMLPVSALPVDGTFPTGNGAVRKTEHRHGNSDLGQGHLYPMRPMRVGVPARGNSHESVFAEVAGRRAGGI